MTSHRTGLVVWGLCWGLCWSCRPPPDLAGPGVAARFGMAIDGSGWRPRVRTAKFKLGSGELHLTMIPRSPQRTETARSPPFFGPSHSTQGGSCSSKARRMCSSGPSKQKIRSCGARSSRRDPRFPGSACHRRRAWTPR